MADTDKKEENEQPIYGGEKGQGTLVPNDMLVRARAVRARAAR